MKFAREFRRQVDSSFNSYIGDLNPLLLSKSHPRGMDVAILHLRPLTFAPCIYFRNDVIYIIGIGLMMHRWHPVSAQAGSLGCSCHHQHPVYSTLPYCVKPCVGCLHKAHSNGAWIQVEGTRQPPVRSRQASALQRVRAFTSLQTSPPFPQPRGGMAIDSIWNLRTCSMRSERPARIYSNFEGWRQRLLWGDFLFRVRWPFILLCKGFLILEPVWASGASVDFKR